MGFNEDKNKTPAQQMEDFKAGRNEKRNNDRRDDRRNDDEDRPGRRNGRDNDSNSNAESDPWGLMSKFRSPISSIAGNALEKFAAPVKDFMESYRSNFKEKYGLDIDIILASPDVTRVKLESVLFCATVSEAGRPVETLVYTMFLPSSSNIGTQYTEGERGRSGLSYSAVASDAYTAEFKRNIETHLRNMPSTNKGSIIHIGAATVPVTFDLSKEDKVKALVIEGVNVLYFQYGAMYKDLNKFALVDLIPNANEDEDDRRNGRRNRRDDEVILNSNVLFKPEETVDVFGLPHSSDISVEVSLGRRRRDKDRPRNALSLEENHVLARLFANVDLVYLGEDDSGDRRRSGRNRFRSSRREESSTQLYGLGLNITDISTEGRDVMGIQLTAIANIALLIKESVLTQALMPAADEVRLRDPRALALEQPESFPADLISENPSEDEWANLMDAILHEDSTYVFLHVPRAGVHSQLLGLLVDACDPDSRTRNDSYDAIVAALDSLTNNEYSELAGDDLEFGELEIRQSFSGYWNDDRSNERRDIAPIGYFNYLTRFGAQHPEYLDIYSRCFDGESDTDECSARMEELLSAYTGKGYTLVDRNDVVRLNPEWISTIADALRDSGVVIDAEGLHTERGRRRPLSSTFATGDLKTGLFRRGRGRSRGGRY